MAELSVCVDCDDKKNLPFYIDPRNPPLEEGLCLCEDCFKTAIIEDLTSVVEELKSCVDKAISVIGRNTVCDILFPLTSFLHDENVIN